MPLARTIYIRALVGFFFLTTSVVSLSAEAQQREKSDEKKAIGQSRPVPDILPAPNPEPEPRILPHPDPDLALQPQERRGSEETSPLTPQSAEPGLSPPPMPQPAKPGLPPPPMPQPAKPPPVVTNPDASPAQPYLPQDLNKKSEKM